MKIPTTTVRVSTLTPHPQNYNEHPPDQVAGLVESLQEFDQFKNVVTWTCPKNMTLDDGAELHEGLTYILAGHGLWQAAIRAGIDELEIKDYSHLSYEKALALLLTDNAAPLGSKPNTDRLADLMERTRGLMADKPGLAEMMAKLRERAGIVEENGAGGEDPGAQVDKAEELRVKWGVETGQLWELGEHKLICGDCTDRGVVETVTLGDHIDFWYGDPPYGVGYANKNKSLNAIVKGNRIQTPIENDHLSVEEIAENVWRPAFANLFDIAKPGCVYYCSAPQGGDQMMMMMMLHESGWLVKHELVWVKNNHVLGRADYQYKHEPIIYGWKPGAAHYFIDSRSEMSVWGIDKPFNSDLHPTTKPLALVEKATRNSSKPGDICADFFLGSGTTLIACQNLNRQCRAIEIDPGYCAVALQRWVDHTKQRPKLVKR